jgi:hypothetical protein
VVQLSSANALEDARTMRRFHRPLFSNAYTEPHEPNLDTKYTYEERLVLQLLLEGTSISQQFWRTRGKILAT